MTARLLDSFRRTRAWFTRESSTQPQATPEVPAETLTFHHTDNLQAAADKACSNAAGNYEDFYKTFVAIDAKAQGAATIAGMVLAGTFAVLKPDLARDVVQSCGSSVGLLVITLPGVLALITVFLALRTIWVRRVTQPYAATLELAEVLDLAQQRPFEQTKERFFKLRLTRLHHWSGAVADIESVVEKKARWLLGTQAVLFVTLLVLIVSVVLVAASLLRSAVLHPG